MSAMTEQFAADVEAVEPDLPVTFYFNGLPYIGQRTPIAGIQEMEDAGFLQKLDFDLIVRCNQFTVAMPVERDVIEIANDAGSKISYHIERVTPAQDGVTVQYGIKQRT